jgi:predicted metal-binding protein
MSDGLTPVPATTIFVCTTCQRNEIARSGDEPRSGEILLALLQAAGSIYPVEAVTCMNNCTNGCTVGFGAPEKWTYVFGDVVPERDVADLIMLADVHQGMEDGQIPWGKRPENLKRKTVSRTPPMFLSRKSGAAA